MKKQESTIIKLTEKFDKELFQLLSNELKAIKNAKNQIVASLPNTNNSLLVA